MLIKPAYAQAAGGEPSFLISLLPLILIFVVFWFLLIRPQQKRMREHREMIAALQKGDKVVTGGGIFGVVSKVVDDATLEVEIAQGVRVRVARSTITENVTHADINVQLPKPANDASAGKKGSQQRKSQKKAAASTEAANDGPAAAPAASEPAASEPAASEGAPGDGTPPTTDETKSADEGQPPKGSAG